VHKVLDHYILEHELLFLTITPTSQNKVQLQHQLIKVSSNKVNCLSLQSNHTTINNWV